MKYEEAKERILRHWNRFHSELAEVKELLRRNRPIDHLETRERKDRNSLFVNETTPDFSIVSRPPAPALRRNMLRRRAGAGGRAVVESELEWAKIGLKWI